MKSSLGSAAILVTLFSSEALAAEGGLKGGGLRKQQREEHHHHHHEDSEMNRHLNSNGACADIYACASGGGCVETPGEAQPYKCTCEPGTEQFTDENGKTGCYYPCDNRAGECPADSHCRQKQVPDASGVLTWTLDCTCNYGWIPWEDDIGQPICSRPCDATPCTAPTAECSNHINWTSPTMDAYAECACPAGLSPIYDDMVVLVDCGDCDQTCPTGSSCKAWAQGGHKCQCDDPLMWNETDAIGLLVRCGLPCDIATCPFPDQTCHNVLLETMYLYNCDCPAGQIATTVTVNGPPECIWPCDVTGACPAGSNCENIITPTGTPWTDCTCQAHYTPNNNEWGYLESCTLDTCAAHQAVGVDACPPNAKCTDITNADGEISMECECETFFEKEFDSTGKWTSCRFVPTCESVQNACPADRFCVPAFADGKGIDCLPCYFCDKYLDTMYITLSHNAFAVDGTVQCPNQAVDEAKQVADGIRGLNFDVYNDPAGLTSSDTNIRPGEIYMMHGVDVPAELIDAVKVFVPNLQTGINPKVSYSKRVQAVKQLLEQREYRAEILIVRFQFELKKTESLDIQKLVEPWGNLVIKNFDSNLDFRHYIEKNQRVLILTKQHANPAIGLHDSHQYLKASKGSWKHWTDKPKMSQKDENLSKTKGHRYARMMSYHTGVLGTTVGNWHGSDIVNVKERILFHARDFLKESWTGGKINILNVDYHTAGTSEGGLYGVFAAQKAIRAGNMNEGCWGNGRGCNWGPDESTCFYCCSDSTSDADVVQGFLDFFTKGEIARKCG